MFFMLENLCSSIVINGWTFYFAFEYFLLNIHHPFSGCWMFECCQVKTGWCKLEDCYRGWINALKTLEINKVVAVIMMVVALFLMVSAILQIVFLVKVLPPCPTAGLFSVHVNTWPMYMVSTWSVHGCTWSVHGQHMISTWLCMVVLAHSNCSWLTAARCI